jgi:hypothetical protein
LGEKDWFASGVWRWHGRLWGGQEFMRFRDFLNLPPFIEKPGVKGMG